VTRRPTAVPISVPARPRSRTARAPVPGKEQGDLPNVSVVPPPVHRPSPASTSRSGPVTRLPRDLITRPYDFRATRRPPRPPGGHKSERVDLKARIPRPGYPAAPPQGPDLAPHNAIRLPCPQAGHHPKSHLRLGPRLALDTRRRNRHASDQAQVTVLRTLVRYPEFPWPGTRPASEWRSYDGTSRLVPPGADDRTELIPSKNR
jgi:hypothetical protein